MLDKYGKNIEAMQDDIEKKIRKNYKLENLCKGRE
jgi:hypothetical protein